MSREGRFLLIVEGVDELRRLPRLLPEIDTQNYIMLDGQGFRGVRDTCKTLGSGFDRPYIGVCDRDLKGDEEVGQQEQSTPGLFFLASRCLENELLHPPLLMHALDMTGHKVSETEILSALRTIADGQYEEVHARLVDSALHRMTDLPLGREEGKTPLSGIRRKYEARRDAAQNRLLTMSAVAARIEDALQGRWDAEHLALLDGKTAMPQIAQQLAPGLKGSRGLESAVIRHAIDFPPPGIAALRAEIGRLIGS